MSFLYICWSSLRCVCTPSQTSHVTLCHYGSDGQWVHDCTETATIKPNPHFSSVLADGQMSCAIAQVLHKTALQAEQTRPEALALLMQPRQSPIAYNFCTQWDFNFKMLPTIVFVNNNLYHLITHYVLSRPPETVFVVGICFFLIVPLLKC